MEIKRLKLNNFRNYSNKEIYFSPGFNTILGPNGIGKTNIIEALYLCAFAKSFKNVKDSDLIKFGENYYYLGLVFKNEIESSIKISFSIDESKKIIYNNNKLKNYSEIIGKIILILSNQDDISIVRGSPDLRRKFLDISLSQFDIEYLLLLKKFKYYLEQRNILLRNKENKNNLFKITNKNFVDLSCKIIYKRLKFIKDINLFLKKYYSEYYNIELRYKLFENIVKYEEVDYFLNYLSRKVMKKEERLGYSCFGPHTDDIIILINNKNSRLFASYGEQKIISILLKLVLNSYFIQKYKKYPVIMLDDIFSDLDKTRVDYINSLLTYKNQIIITTQDDTIQTGNRIIL